MHLPVTEPRHAAMTRQRQPEGSETAVTAAKIRAVCLSQRRDSPKNPVDRARLRAGWGLVGDSHAGPRQPDRWQVSLPAWQKVQSVNQEHGLDAAPGSFEENLSTDGVDTLRLRVGDRLSLGSEVLLEVEQLGKPAGVAHTYNYRSHALLPSDGVFCRVVIGGHSFTHPRRRSCTVRFGVFLRLRSPLRPGPERVLGVEEVV